METGEIVGGIFFMVLGVIVGVFGRKIADGTIVPAMGQQTPENTTEASWMAMSTIVGNGFVVCAAAYALGGVLLPFVSAVSGFLLVGGTIYMLAQTARGAIRLEPRRTPTR